MSVAARARQAGMTLLEVMIATAILLMMMTLTWQIISRTHQRKLLLLGRQEVYHGQRMAMLQVVRDLEAAYLSRNECQPGETCPGEPSVSAPRTQFVGKDSGEAGELVFSTLAHRVQWGDANESEQTLISYVAMKDRERPDVLNWVRREQRRLSYRLRTEEPAEYDILVPDIKRVVVEYWDWRGQEWRKTWDSTAADRERGRLPERVRITVTQKARDGEPEKNFTTQARLLLQEPLNFSL